MNFKNMFDFGYRRTFLEALVFYLFWCLFIFLFILVLSAVCTFCYFLLFEVYHLIKLPLITMKHLIGALSRYFSGIICLAVTLLIIFKKKIYSIWRILLLLITICSCFFLNRFDALLGFVFTSILTTFPNKEETVKIS